MRKSGFLAGGLAILLPHIVAAAPIPKQWLKLSAQMQVFEDLGYVNTCYNPRNFNNQNFVGELALGDVQGIARYPTGSPVPEATLDFADSSSNTESRMWAPMDGGQGTDFVLLAGGSNQDRFSRLDYGSLQNRIFVGPALRPESFDWVDNDTIVFTSYEPGLRKHLYGGRSGGPVQRFIERHLEHKRGSCDSGWKNSKRESR